jgi:hypothetical protein
MKLSQKIFLTLICFFYSLTSFSQTHSHSHRINLYPELGGNAILWSGNLEYQYIRDKVGLTLRTGAGVIPLPLFLTQYANVKEIGFLYGKKVHFFETGIGETRFKGLLNSDYSGIYSLKAGYRFISKRGFLFRATVLLSDGPDKNENFTIEENKPFFHAGISLGYSIKVYQKKSSL